MQLSPALTSAAEKAREGKWAEVIREIDKAWPAIETGDQLDDMCAAQALKGRALVAQGSDDKAAIPFAKVLSLYEGRMLTSVGELSDPSGLARARVVVEAVSEATFFTAARRDRELRKARAPVYRGDGEKKDIERFTTEQFSIWLKHRLDAIELLDQAYQRVLFLEPMYSPRWAVKACERIGALYISLVADINAVPIPKAWTGPGEIAGIPKQDVRDAYAAALASGTAPFTARTKFAYTECAALAKRYRVPISEVDHCTQWLQDHN